MTTMTMLRTAGSGALALVLVVSSVTAAQDPVPGPAADTIRFNSYFVDRAPLEIQAGTMDLYLYEAGNEVSSLTFVSGGTAEVDVGTVVTNDDLSAAWFESNPTASPSSVRTALYNLTTKGKVTSSKTTNNHLLFTNY